MNSKSIFTERQAFRSPFILFPVIAISLGLILLFGFGLYAQIVLDKPFGNNPMSNTGLIVASVLVFVAACAVTALMLVMRLDTRIDREAISFRFVPFHRSWKTIRRKEIADMKVTTYNPVGDYGGWGIGSGKKGKAYNVKGNKGLLINLKTGKSILIGTQKDQRLKEFLEETGL